MINVWEICLIIIFFVALIFIMFSQRRSFKDFKNLTDIVIRLKTDLDALEAWKAKHVQITDNSVDAISTKLDAILSLKQGIDTKLNQILTVIQVTGDKDANLGK
jgi:predicted PurR-regulated permease PerM